MISIRKSVESDLETIVEIYNQAILTTVATFDTEPKTADQQRAWFLTHGDRSPLLVAEDDGCVVAWASLSRWSDRCAYIDTAEVSVYVRKEHQGRGLGKMLLVAILDEGRSAGLHTVIARIAQGNEGSFELFISLGFEHIGTMKEVGRKFGKLLDVYLLQLIYR